MNIIESGAINEKDKYNIQWEITHNCIYNCKYCFTYDRTIPENKLKKINPNNFTNSEPFFKSCIDTIDFLIDEPEYLYILITGGEPTLHPQLNFIVKYLYQKIQNIREVSIHTNLSLSTDKLNNLLKNVDKNRFTLFASYHSNFTNYNEFQKRVDILNKNDIKYKISVMMEPNRYDDLLYFVNNFKKDNGLEKYYNISMEPLYPIELQQYDEKYFELERVVNSETNKRGKTKDIYYIIQKEDGSIIREEYYLSEIKKLPKEYHNFCGMNCYKYRHLLIQPDRQISCRCADLSSKYKRMLCVFNNNKKHDFKNQINQASPCNYPNCIYRDGIRCIKKYK